MARSPTVLSSWAQIIVDALDAHGHDSAALLRRAGLERHGLNAPSTRQSLSTTRVLWHAAVEVFDDPACGLTVSRYVRPTTFHALGYAVAASVSLRDALRMLIRYSRVVSDANEFRLDTFSDRVRLVILPYAGRVEEVKHPHISVRPVGYETVDALMSLLLRTCRWLAGREMSPILVEQRRPQPSDDTPYQRFFRSPIHFGETEDAMTFDASWLDRRLPGGISTLAEHNEELVRRHLAKVEAGDLCDRVRDVLQCATPAELTPAQVARRLSLTERTLQRHLHQAGTSFAVLLSEARFERACSYLLDPKWSLEDIALRLGFNSVSAFARAFRRWTQLSPTVFRKQKIALLSSGNSRT